MSPDRNPNGGEVAPISHLDLLLCRNTELETTSEELQTMNDELRTRTEEFSQSNGFMEAVFRSGGTGAVVLDRDLEVRVSNHKAEDLWGFWLDEVEGQRFLGLDIGLPVQKLREPVRRLITGEDLECEEVVQALTRRGKAIHRPVTCTPLPDEGRSVDGAIPVVEEWQGASQGDLRRDEEPPGAAEP